MQQFIANNPGTVRSRNFKKGSDLKPLSKKDWQALQASNPSNHNEQWEDLPSYCVALSSPANPNSQHSHTLTIEKLSVEPEETNKTKWCDTVNVYGLEATWNEISKRNAINCMEVHHSIPFYRIMNLGFFAQPGPRDLGGILNANALYCFSTGLLQILFGIILMIGQTSLGESITPNQIIPFTVSILSFMLGLANVLLDFAGSLDEVAAEEALTARTVSEMNEQKTTKIEQAQKRLAKRLREIEADFDKSMLAVGSASPTSKAKVTDEAKQTNIIVKSQLMRQRAGAMCQLDVNNANLECKMMISALLLGYREEKESLRAMLAGTHKDNPEGLRALLLEAGKCQTSAYSWKAQNLQKLFTAQQEAKQKINNEVVEKVTNLDVSLSIAAFRSKLDEATENGSSQCRALDEKFALAVVAQDI